MCYNLQNNIFTDFHRSNETLNKNNFLEPHFYGTGYEEISFPFQGALESVIFVKMKSILNKR